MSKAAEFAVILKMNPMFADLDAYELQRISSLCHTQHLGAGEALFHKGDPGDALFGVRPAKSGSKPAPPTAAG